MHTYEVFSILNKVYSKFGSSEFGRISQILLGFSFIHSGYKVPTMQLSGRPDIVANKGENSFIVEVKTSNLPAIRLKKEDLRGIYRPEGSQSVIAVLSYPDVDIFWILADALRLRAGEYSKSALMIFSLRDLENEINQRFFSVIEKYQSSIMQGTNLLLQVFREEQNRGL
jgi:Holliday junction resolvase